MENIILGGYINEEVAKINENFNEVETDYAKKTEIPTVPTVPANVSEFNNDAGYVDETDVLAIVTEQLASEVPTKMSELTNDANYVKTTDATFVNKVDKEVGKGLSTNDYTTEDKNKVANLGKIDFTTSNFGSADADGYYTATLTRNGKYPVKVMRQNGTTYEDVLVQTKVTENNILIMSTVAFNGYVVTM